MQSLIQTKFQDQLQSLASMPMQAEIQNLQNQLHKFSVYSEQLVQELQSKEEDLHRLTLELSSHGVFS